MSIYERPGVHKFDHEVQTVWTCAKCKCQGDPKGFLPWFIAVLDTNITLCDDCGEAYHEHAAFTAQLEYDKMTEFAKRETEERLLWFLEEDNE